MCCHGTTGPRYKTDPTRRAEARLGAVSGPPACRRLDARVGPDSGDDPCMVNSGTRVNSGGDLGSVGVSDSYAAVHIAEACCDV